MARRTNAAASQPFAKRGFDDLDTTRTHARHLRQPTVMGGCFERFQGIDVEFLVNAVRQMRADTRNGLKQCLRLNSAAQPFELDPAAGGDHLGNGAGNRPADGGQGDQPLNTAVLEDTVHRNVERRHRIGRMPIGVDPKMIGVLGFENIGNLAQVARDRQVCG